MQLYNYLKNSFCFALMRARYDLRVSQQTVAEKCGMSISDLDDVELGLKPLDYIEYERLLRFYKKRTAINKWRKKLENN